MADSSRIVNLSTVTLNSKEGPTEGQGQGQEEQDLLDTDTGSIGEVPEEEEYITGLEGIGHIESLATLDGLEFSTNMNSRKSSTTTTTTAAMSATSTNSVNSLDPLAAASTIATVSSSSTVADPDKRSSETFSWIERILELYYRGGTSKTAQNVGSAILQKLFACEDDEDGEAIRFLAPIADDERKVTLVDYEITPFDQPTMLNDEQLPMLSKMLSLKAKYQVKAHVGLNYELFVVKLPPERTAERELATKTNAHHREICFYNRILPFLQEWSTQQGVQVQFGIPICIYGAYRRPFDENPVLLDEISNVESVLMLEDVRADEFGKRHFIEGLSVEEAKAAIAEICKIHVASWAFHQQDGYHAVLRSPAHRPPDVARLYEGLVQEGLKLFKAYLQKEMPKKTQYVPILEKLRSLELRIYPLLLELMELPKPPAPICLIHMDFWCDNILFRQAENPNAAPPAAAEEQQVKDTYNDAIEAGRAAEELMDATANTIGSDGNELDGESWRPKPFIPEYPSSIRRAKAKKPPSPAPSSSTTAPASTSKPFPKDLEYLTDPAYACVDLKDTDPHATYKTVPDSLNNLAKKLLIKDASLECRIIDWQLFSYGSPTHDLAVLILTSLTPETRRNNTEMLLKYYLQVFDSTVELYKLKAPFDLGCLRKQFKRSKLLAFLLLVANMEIILADETTQERFIEVVKDLITDNVI